MNERRPANVIPHLAGHEREHNAQADETPAGAVVEEVEVVTPHVQQPADQHGQEEHYGRRGVVGRAKHANLQRTEQ